MTKGVDLRGKTAVVTGCTSGIGYEVMRVLALRGAHVIGTARSLQKGKNACESIRGAATPVDLELSDFDSVLRCAEQIRSLSSAIDMLILNAGIVLSDWQQVRGLERQFVVNHLGHFLLTAYLLESVRSAAQGRVIVVGSGSHRNAPAGGIQFDDLSGRSWSEHAYAHSKLANGLFSLALSRKLHGSRATSNCVSPGHTRTNILRDSGNSYRPDARTPAQGAATICHVACSASAATMNGEYVADCARAEQSAYQTDLAMATRLWEISAALAGAPIDFADC